MFKLARYLWVRILAGVLFLGFATAGTTLAASYAPRFDRPTLDSMLAPIALYPDRLLSHVLMAATYPEEVEEAARWIRARPGLSGDAAVRAGDGSEWDPSVRSLLAFPLVLDTLADHPRWTQDLGEAFLSQREEVMEVIQFLRRRALQAGTLHSNEAIRVIDQGYAIVIEPAGPQTVHVPYYDPHITYGSWWWPARPPMHWPRWPGYYVQSGPHSHFVWGPATYISSGFFFGNFVWARREVRVVDVRPYYYPRRVVVERHVVPGRPVPHVEHRAPTPGVWQHDSRRRLSDEARAARRVNEGRAAEDRDRARRDDDDRNVRRAERRDDDDRNARRIERRDGDGDDRGRGRGNERRGDDRPAPPAARLAEPGAAPQAAPVPRPNVAAENQPRGQARGHDRDDAARAAARAERRDDGRRDADDRSRRGGDPPPRAISEGPPRAGPPPGPQAQPKPEQDRPYKPRARDRSD